MNLASLFVEFSQKGAKEMLGAMNAASASLSGWIRLGLQATAEGDRLAFAQQHLGQTIASIFLPVIDKATEWLARFDHWLSNTGAGAQLQDTIERLVEAFGGLVETILPVAADLLIGLIDIFDELIPASDTIASAIKKIGDFIREYLLPYVKDAILGFELMAAAMGRVLGLTDKTSEQVTHAFKEREASRNQRTMRRVGVRGGGMDANVFTAYERLQRKANQMGTIDYPKKQTDLLEKIEKNTGKPSQPVVENSGGNI